MQFCNPVTRADVSADSAEKVMDEPVRWVTKAEAAQELEISLSTLDRKIRKREVEVVRRGRRVYVRMLGPEYMSDEGLLRRTIIREDELERTVPKLERIASELERGASELKRERDEAREAASASRQAYEELEEAYRKECPMHGRTRRLALRLGLVAAALVVLLAVTILVTWRLFM